MSAGQRAGHSPIMTKARIRAALDALMALALMLLMGYHLWGEAAHEWVGTGMFALAIAHNAINARWYRSILRGRYTPLRALQAALDLLMLIDMLALMTSGMVMSNHVFRFLNIRGGMSLARLAHMAASYWGYVLMSLHMGLHLGALMGRARRAPRGRTTSRARRMALAVLGALIVAYGAMAFVRRGLPDYMLLRVRFVFFDYGEPAVLFYMDYIAMTGALALIAHCIRRALSRHRAIARNKGRA